eukprot:TRINITY_DN12280_c0_g1_i4.p1 TRINITY_DN12280_c0_g1~~TRINITY_DN12280_c0_g1_i4.p1  ORF type:complete len:956 (+),score=124.76 TRINITY_DN12280_c0_g1_i4:107-2974(+)
MDLNESQHPLSERLTDPINLLHIPNTRANVALAYNYVLDAMDGRLKHGRGTMYFAPRWKQITYLVQTSEAWTYFVYFACVLHSCLAFAKDASTRHPASWVLALEFLSMAIYFADIALKASYMGPRIYISKKAHKMQVLLTSIYLLDWLITVSGAGVVRFATALRPTFLVGRHRDIRRIFFLIVELTPKLARVMSILAGFILVFAMLGVAFLQQPYGGSAAIGSVFQGAFDHVPIASLRMFVLFTTENYPHITVPAWVDTRWSFLFFFVFVYGGVFFLTALLLALIVSLYLERAGDQVHSERKKEWKGLIKAFELLDERGRGYIDLPQFCELMEILRPGDDLPAVHFYYQLLDRDGNRQVDPFDFLDMREILLLHAAKLDDKRRIPSTRVAVHTPFIHRLLVRYTRWPYRAATINILIGINTVIGCATWSDMSKRDELVVIGINLTLAVLFVIDKATKIGLKKIKSISADAVSTVASLLLLIVAVSIDAHNVVPATIANVITLMRLPWRSPDARFGMLLLHWVLGVLFHLSILMVAVCYFFAAVGWEMYRDYGADDPDAFYAPFNCGIGFKTLGCSMFTLFQVVTGSNWQDAMNSAMKLANWHAAIYFVIFYIISNLILMDLLLAVTIEVFIGFRRRYQGLSVDDLHQAFIEIPHDVIDDYLEAAFGKPRESSSDVQVHSLVTKAHEQVQKNMRQSESLPTRRRSRASSIFGYTTRSSLEVIKRRLTLNTSQNSETINFERPKTAGNTVYRLHRDRGPWRRELSGREDALTLISAADLKKLNKSIKLDLIAMHQAKARTRQETVHKLAMHRLARGGSEEENGVLSRISPILHWWKAYQSLLEIEGEEEDGSSDGGSQSSGTIADKPLSARRRKSVFTLHTARLEPDDLDDPEMFRARIDPVDTSLQVPTMPFQRPVLRDRNALASSQLLSLSIDEQPEHNDITSEGMSDPRVEKIP